MIGILKKFYYEPSCFSEATRTCRAIEEKDPVEVRWYFIFRWYSYRYLDKHVPITFF